MDATNLNKRDAQIKAAALDTSIPAFLRRETNSKGITLSGGSVAHTGLTPDILDRTGTDIKDTVVDQSTSSQSVVVASAKRTEPKAKKVAAPKAPKPVKAVTQPKVAKVKKPAKPAPIIDSATGQPIVKVVRSIVPMRFKAKYAKHNGTCGDDMALELKAATTKLNEDKRETLDVDALWAIASQNKLDVTKYVNLNNGQKRMNVGNKLRGMLADGKDVKIGTGKSARVFKAEDFAPRG